MLKCYELTKIEDGNVTGPMSPLLFVKEFMAQKKTPPAAKIWRVEADMTFRDGAERGTGDMLLALTIAGDLVLLVDFGFGGRAAGVKWRDEDEVRLFDGWRKDEEFFSPPTDEDLKELVKGIDVKTELAAIRKQLEEKAS